jgi:RNA polymerase sigma-70 factor (ECF subfamily)
MAESALTRSKQDSRAFGDFYRVHAVAITRYLARRVLDAEVALDLTAETFAQAYAGRGGFRGQTDAEGRAWLYTIAQRQLASYLQRGYADRAALARLGLERPAAEPEELQRVEELGDMAELRALLAQQMEDLPQGYRDAVRLRVVEELPYPEVAQRLAITETAARMRVSRALGHLRTALTPGLPAEGIS